MTWDRIYAWSTGAGDDRRPFLLENLTEQATSRPETAHGRARHGSPPSTPF